MLSKRLSQRLCRLAAIVNITLMTSPIVSNASATEIGDVREEILRLNRHMVVFGHQSVGDNILDGVKRLAHQSGVTFDATEIDSTKGANLRGFNHFYVAENGDPSKKLSTFESTLNRLATEPDIAFLKFCYVDFSADTNPTELFAKYRATIDRLRSRYPKTVFVHVTAPLVVIQTGPKALIKRVLGRAPSGVKENIARNNYNELLRRTYFGREPIFDLAQIEATDSTSERALSIEWNGVPVPTLSPQLSNDGGHLNVVGEERAARELLSVLGRVLSDKGIQPRLHQHAK